MSDKSEINFMLINGQAKRKEDIFLDNSYTLKNLFGSAYIVQKDGQETEWICKIYTKNFEQFRKEVENLKKLHDVNGIPKLLYFQDDIMKFTIISRQNGIDLFEFIRHKKFTVKQVKNIIKNILLIVSELHSRQIVHGDIKPENIIYDEKTEEIALIDFEQDKHTKEYIPPELIRNSMNVDSKNDMWSIGITCYVLLEKEYPFRDSTEILYEKLSIPYYWGIDQETFMYGLLNKDMHKRFSCSEALNHEWLNE